jgi:hypothetical protein
MESVNNSDVQPSETTAPQSALPIQTTDAQAAVSADVANPLSTSLCSKLANARSPNMPEVDDPQQSSQVT